MVPDVLTSCLNFAREIKQIFRLAECPMPLFISMILAYAYSSVQRLHSDSYSSILSVLYLQYHAESTSFFSFLFLWGGITLTTALAQTIGNGITWASISMF